MPSIRSLAGNLSVALCCLTTAAASQTPRTTEGSATFVVLLAGSRIGSETVSVTHSAGGWSISSTGRVLAPIDLATNTFEMRYGDDWRPQQLTIDARLRGRPLALTTTFNGTSAVSQMTREGAETSMTQAVSAETVVLPNSFFGAYEALAARLGGAAIGARLPVFVAPGPEITLIVERVAERRFVSPDGPVSVREFILSSSAASAPTQSPIEIWIDAHGRLVRLVAPTASIVVVRSDLASVMAREERTHNPGDQDVFIPANGFNLAGTITKPASGAARFPAVVLVASAGPQDRDYSRFGVAVLGQLAGELATSGYVVVRYDGRNVGQSGGRVESAGVAEYADDALAVVKWVRRRSEVDSNRVAVLGYGEGGAVAMTAAAHAGDIKALALVGVAGRDGRSGVLDQQRRVLDRMGISDAERTARIEMQNRIIQAALATRPADDLPADLVAASRSPWFKSWLLFDPAKVMPDVKQPVLILQGGLDAEAPPADADRLEALGRARRKSPDSATRKVIVPAVNHLLTPARTGESDEYPILETRTVSPAVGRAIAAWLGEAMPAR